MIPTIPIRTSAADLCLLAAFGRKISHICGVIVRAWQHPRRGARLQASVTAREPLAGCATRYTQAFIVCYRVPRNQRAVCVVVTAIKIRASTWRGDNMELLAFCSAEKLCLRLKIWRMVAQKRDVKFQDCSMRLYGIFLRWFRCIRIIRKCFQFSSHPHGDEISLNLPLLSSTCSRWRMWTWF